MASCRPDSRRQELGRGHHSRENVRFTRSRIASIGYELAPIVVSSAELEERLGPLYQKLHVQPGQLAALTGIGERRWWQPGTRMAEGATLAARATLEQAGFDPSDLDMVIFASVCRDQLEPATACEVAAGIGTPASAQVYDISNACLGVVNGMVAIATAIEAGQARAGLVVGCESAREIVEQTIERMLEAGDHGTFRHCLATLTGGSGAVGVLVVAEDLAPEAPALTTGVLRNDVQHHRLCVWGPDTGVTPSAKMQMDTDAVSVLTHGVKLGVDTWNAFLQSDPFAGESPSHTICHQVGQANRDSILRAIQMPPENDFVTYPFLGNVGTVSMPITAAIAAERGAIGSGDRVAFCGIGSGLNCLILGVRW
jgi:3-oxoacyl-[acyl-carrier-protein] synthase-3